MGRIKYLSKIREFLKKTPVISARDIEFIVASKEYAHLLLHNLTKKGEIYRLTKGYYSKEPDPILSVFCFKPAYLGLQEALSLHNLWEQETVPVIVTARKAREGIRHVLSNNVIIRRIPSKYFFGFELLKYGDFFIPVSDIEKTLIDLIYFKETPSKETLKEARKKVRRARLDSYLQHYPLEFRKIARKIIGNG